ncbi:MAG TPA: MauE/DoxX family redox-associated membrane protein, partial [Ktedonobacteraceae bacterium]|nr:MauE/DoxX family redox-associated membrane protein [Ktedonobacteraceae bacterium]
MTVAFLLARLLLSAVFLIAGLAKLADLPGSQRALHNFGVPEMLARPLGIVLPIVEIVTAIALVSAHWARYGA